jgi:ribose-phosphate pyrophosphokinase
VDLDDLIVVDLHSEDSLKDLIKRHKLKVHTLSAIPVLAKHLKENGYDEAFSLSPDIGAVERVKLAQPVLNGGFGYFEKKRDRATGAIEMYVKDLYIEGKNAVVFDDIISSGGTMARAIKNLKDQGAASVAAACTHALFMPGAIEKLESAGTNHVLTTDTVETEYEKVSVSGIISDYLKNQF